MNTGKIRVAVVKDEFWEAAELRVVPEDWVYEPDPGKLKWFDIIEVPSEMVPRFEKALAEMNSIWEEINALVRALDD